MKQLNKSGLDKYFIKLRLQIFFYKTHIRILFIVIGLFFLQATAQQPSPKPDWSAFQFLLGEWTGEGSGQPGDSSAGAFTLAPDLDGTVLVRHSFADYPAAGGRPAVHHTDLMVIYRDGAGKPIRATYWDNEGHVIPYSVQTSAGSAVFTRRQ